MLKLPVTIREAVLGDTLEVPTIKGRVRVTHPAELGHRHAASACAAGASGGHQYVELEVVLPPGKDPGFREFLGTWQPAHPFNPAAGSGGDLMRTDAILALFSDVQKTELTDWIERGWVQPEPEEPRRMGIPRDRRGPGATDP